jgi:hypothetical protein
MPASAPYMMGGGHYWTAQRTCMTSSPVPSGEQVEREKSEKALEDEKRKIADRLRELNARRKPAAGARPAAPPPPPAQAPRLLPTPAPAVAPPPSFLPGAQGEGPIEEAARAVRALEDFGKKLLAMGTALEQRVGSDNPPTKEERAAFLEAEEGWRLSVKYSIDVFKQRSRDEAVQALKALLGDKTGPRLAEIRVHLGG